MGKCKHDWRTKYSKYNGYLGVEWYCTNRCNTNLAWPEAIKRVNNQPDLLEALEELVFEIGHWTTTEERHIAKAKQAIAKVKGG